MKPRPWKAGSGLDTYLVERREGAFHWRGRGGGGYSSVDFLVHFTTEHASPRETEHRPAPSRDTSDNWALIMLFPCIAYHFFAKFIPVLFSRLWAVLIFCLPLVIRPLTTHPFRDGAPVLLVTKMLSTLDRS